MKRTTLALAFTGLVLGGGSTLLFAGDDPAPAPRTPLEVTPTEGTEIQQRVEDLGSADFRVREAAWKALVGFGAKARPALEVALKSENPSVRFRAEQLISRLNGGTREKPLDDGTPPAPDASPRGSIPGTPGHGFTNDDFDRLMRETQERFKKLEEELNRQFGAGGPSFGTQWFGGALGGGNGQAPGLRVYPWAESTGTRQLRVNTDGGALRESPRGARIELADKSVNGTTMSTVYEGKSVDAILEAYPELRAHSKVNALLQKRTDELAVREEREKALKDRQKGPSVQSMNKSVTVQTDGTHATVSITETGPDGKQTTKTYEGADVESIKRDHPEIADSLDGMHIEVGPQGGGIRPLEPIPSDDPFGSDKAELRTGPFGLGLMPIDEALRTQLSLDAGKGAVIAAVRAGSQADRVGLKAHDVVVAINSTPITSVEQVAELVRAAKDGELSFEVLRGGKAMTLKR